MHLLILVDEEPTKEYILFKILEKLDTIQSFLGLGGLKPTNLHIKNSNNNEIISLKTNGDYQKLLIDGSTIYCELKTNEIWLTVKSTLKSNFFNLSMNFQVRVNLGIPLTDLKMLLLKQLLCFMKKQHSEEKRHYVISNTVLKIKKPNQKYVESINKKIFTQKEIDNLLIEDIFGFNSLLELDIEFSSVEEIVFEYIKRVINSKSMYRNSNNQKKKSSINSYLSISDNTVNNIRIDKNNKDDLEQNFNTDLRSVKAQQVQYTLGNKNTPGQLDSNNYNILNNANIKKRTKSERKNIKHLTANNDYLKDRLKSSFLSNNSNNSKNTKYRNSPAMKVVSTNSFNQLNKDLESNSSNFNLKNMTFIESHHSNYFSSNKRKASDEKSRKINEIIKNDRKTLEFLTLELKEFEISENFEEEYAFVEEFLTEFYKTVLTRLRISINNFMIRESNYSCFDETFDVETTSNNSMNSNMDYDDSSSDEEELKYNNDYKLKLDEQQNYDNYLIDRNANNTYSAFDKNMYCFNNIKGNGYVSNKKKNNSYFTNKYLNNRFSKHNNMINSNDNTEVVKTKTNFTVFPFSVMTDYIMRFLNNDSNANQTDPNNNCCAIHELQNDDTNMFYSNIDDTFYDNISGNNNIGSDDNIDKTENSKKKSDEFENKENTIKNVLPFIKKDSNSSNKRNEIITMNENKAQTYDKEGRKLPNSIAGVNKVAQINLAKNKTLKSTLKNNDKNKYYNKQKQCILLIFPANEFCSKRFNSNSNKNLTYNKYLINNASSNKNNYLVMQNSIRPSNSNIGNPNLINDQTGVIPREINNALSKNEIMTMAKNNNSRQKLKSFVDQQSNSQAVECNLNDNNDQENQLSLKQNLLEANNLVLSQVLIQNNKIEFLEDLSNSNNINNNTANPHNNLMTSQRKVDNYTNSNILFNSDRFDNKSESNVKSKSNKATKNKILLNNIIIVLSQSDLGKIIGKSNPFKIYMNSLSKLNAKILEIRNLTSNIKDNGNDTSKIEYYIPQDEQLSFNNKIIMGSIFLVIVIFIILSILVMFCFNV